MVISEMIAVSYLQLVIWGFCGAVPCAKVCFSTHLTKKVCVSIRNIQQFLSSAVFSGDAFRTRKINDARWFNVMNNSRYDYQAFSINIPLFRVIAIILLLQFLIEYCMARKSISPSNIPSKNHTNIHFCNENGLIRYLNFSFLYSQYRNI